MINHRIRIERHGRIGAEELNEKEKDTEGVKRGGSGGTWNENVVGQIKSLDVEAVAGPFAP